MKSDCFSTSWPDTAVKNNAAHWSSTSVIKTKSIKDWKDAMSVAFYTSIMNIIQHKGLEISEGCNWPSVENTERNMLRLCVCASAEEIRVWAGVNMNTML